MSVLIPLTRGLQAVIDDVDLSRVNKYRWHAHESKYTNNVYARADFPLGGSKYRRVYLHHFLVGADPGQPVDHKDHDGLNNQQSNLRVCTQSQNLGNQRISKNNTSGYKGVYWRKDLCKWAAKLQSQGAQVYLGLFTDPWEAAQAYNEVALIHWGEFALLNERRPDQCPL